MLKKLLHTLIAGVLVVPCQAQCRIDYSNYQLVFEESFNNISSVSQLAARWNFVPAGDPGWAFGDYVDPVTNIRTYGEYYSMGQLSLQPGGLLRITAEKINGSTPVWSDWLSAWRYPKYKSGMLELRTNLNTAPYDVTATCGGRTGFLYGMYEARIKLSSLGSFPAFWLTTGGPTEIDILEFANNNNNRRMQNNVIWWNGPGSSSSCAAYFTKQTGTDITADYHIYTCVWTPSLVTFFLDGRELRTVPSSQLATSPLCAASPMVNLAMFPWNDDQMVVMDIDYIKVYKPVNNNFSIPFKTSSSYMHHDAFLNATGTYTDVSPVEGSIATNPNNANEVFYKGTDNRLYVGTRSNGIWNFKKLEYNDGAQLSNAAVAYDVRYLPQHDKVVYIGLDKRIHLFGRSSTEPQGWYHWYIDNGVQNAAHAAALAPCVMVTTADGQIVYKGNDQKMHRYYYNASSNTFINQVLGSYASSGDYVSGDLAVAPNGHIFFRGNDTRLQTIYPDQNGNYIRTHIDNNWSTGAYLMANRPGSLVFSASNNGLFYIGSDDKIHLYYFDNGWTHTLIPHTYGQAGHPKADYSFSGLAWDESLQKLYYLGFDGRIQAFQKSGGSWIKYWVDDYWNTTEYSSYSNISATNGYSSTVLGSDNPDKSIFYTTANKRLAYFDWEPCQVELPCDAQVNIRSKKQNNSKFQRVEVPYVVYPNPATKAITLKCGDQAVTSYDITILGVYGNVLIKQYSASSETTIDISALTAGQYFMEVKNTDAKKTLRFTKL